MKGMRIVACAIAALSILAASALLYVTVLPPYMSTAVPLARGQHPVWCQQNCPDSKVIAFHQLNNSTTRQQIWRMNADGTNQTCISCTTAAQANLPQLNQGNCEWTHSGNWLACQVQAAASTQGNAGAVGAGRDDEIWFIDPNGTTSFYRMAAELPQTGQGYVQCRLSPDGKLYWCGKLQTWSGTSGVLGLGGTLRLWNVTDGAVPTLTGTGISTGIANGSPITYSSGGSVSGSVTCSLTTTPPTGGQTAVLYLTSVSGSFSGVQAFVHFAGSGYSSVPTSWTLSGTGCSGTVTTTGGVLGGADFYVPDNTQSYFVEAATGLPMESTSRTICFSAAGSTTQALRQYCMDTSASQPWTTVRTVSFGGVEWSEMGKAHNGMYAFVSSEFTGVTPPVTIANPALDVAYVTTDGRYSGPITLMNLLGSPQYFYNGTTYATAEDFDFSPDGSKIIININNVQSYNAIYLLALQYTSSQWAGQYKLGGRFIAR